MGIGPVPEQREDGGIIEGRRRGEPVEFPRKLGEREIQAGKGDEACGDLHRRVGIGPVFCHTPLKDRETRRQGTSNNTFNKQTQGSQETQNTTGRQSGIDDQDDD